MKSIKSKISTSMLHDMSVYHKMSYHDALSEVLKMLYENIDFSKVDSINIALNFKDEIENPYLLNMTDEQVESTQNWINQFTLEIEKYKNDTDPMTQLYVDGLKSQLKDLEMQLKPFKE